MSNKIHSALESIAQRDISDDTNLWPQIAARIEQKDHVMNPKLKLAWTVVLTLLALALATTAVYALYRYFSDPGMKSVDNAGMVQNVNATAQPTVLPPGTTPGPVIASGTVQTLEGVTVTLDWVFAQGFDQVFHISARGLAPDMHFGMPSVTYDGAPQENENRGAIFSTNTEPEQMTGIYMMRQMMAENLLDVALDIPLFREKTQLASFHFEMKNVSVYNSQGSDRSIYAFQTNNIVLTLKWLNMTPDHTTAHVCYQGSEDWLAKKATVKFGSAKDRSDGSEVSAADFGPVVIENDERCMDIGFQLNNNAAIRWLVLTVDDLSIASGETQSGPWHFEEDVPSLEWLRTQLLVPNLPTPTAAPQPTIIPGTTPISQSEGVYTATLLSAYADANRVVFIVHLDGWKNYSLQKGFYYDFGLTSPVGTYLDIPNIINSLDPETHDMTFVFSPVVGLKTERLTGKFNLSIQEDMLANSAIQAFHFEFDLPVYKSTLQEMEQSINVDGITVWLEAVEISPSFTKLDLCYAKPFAGEWLISGPTLQAGSSQAATDSVMSLILFDSDTVPDPTNLADDFSNVAGEIIRKEHHIEVPAGVEHSRCEQLGFPIGSQDQPKTLTLTIPELAFFPDEISDADIKIGQEKLKPQGIEFTFNDESVSGNGFGGGGRIFVVKKKPDGMRDDQVFRLFSEALGHFHPGPWVFTVELKP